MIKFNRKINRKNLRLFFRVFAVNRMEGVRA